MQIKKLQWGTYDFAHGSPSIYYTEGQHALYTIRRSYDEDAQTPCFKLDFLFGYGTAKPIGGPIPTVEEAKLIAQHHFEDYITEHFLD